MATIDNEVGSDSHKSRSTLTSMKSNNRPITAIAKNKEVKYNGFGSSRRKGMLSSDNNAMSQSSIPASSL